MRMAGWLWLASGAALAVLVGAGSVQGQCAAQARLGMWVADVEDRGAGVTLYRITGDGAVTLTVSYDAAERQSFTGEVLLGPLLGPGGTMLGGHRAADVQTLPLRLRFTFMAQVMAEATLDLRPQRGADGAAAFAPVAALPEDVAMTVFMVLANSDDLAVTLEVPDPSSGVLVERHGFLLEAEDAMAALDAADAAFDLLDRAGCG